MKLPTATCHRPLIWLSIFALALVALVQDEEAFASPERIADLKARYTTEQIRTDEQVLREFVTVNAAARGIDPHWQLQRNDRQREASPLLSQLLESQWVASRNLLAQGWGGSVTWDERRLSPRQVKPGVLLPAATAQAAWAQFELRFGDALTALFAMSAGDSREVLDIRDAEIPMPHGSGPPLKGRRMRFERFHGGLPVFGDRFQVTLTKRAESPHWAAQVIARWTRTVETANAKLSQQAALDRLRGSAGQATFESLGSPRLGYLPNGSVARLAWEIWGRENGELFRYFVSALDGDTLERQRQSSENHDGTVRAFVKRPHEGVASPRPMPFLAIFEDAKNYPTEASCFFTPGFDPQTRGDLAQHNATTDYLGQYENALHFDPADLSWVADFQGPFVRDISPYQDRTVTGILAGADHTISDSSSNGRNRRGELFYLLNYGARLYESYLIPQYEPMGYHFDALGAEGAPEGACLDEEVMTGCCGGGTEPGCFYMECDMGTTGTAAAERRFREVAMHEQVHQLAYKANGGSLCSGCGGDPNTDGKECACWEEGRADFGAIAINQFEKHRADFMPGLLYPDDWGGASLYGPGAIFTAIYVDYLLRAGLDGIGDVQRNLDLVDGDTRMVGSCASAVDWTTCPANSFYRHLIANQEQWTFPRWRNTQEISAVFHDHVKDADRGTAGVQEFPWADGIPNRLFNAPTLYTDLAGGSAVVATQGNDGGGSIALNSADDWDNVMFLARAGETYTVRTQDLAAGVDTMLEVRTIDATQSYLVAENDDCGAGPDSCLTFQAQDTGFHRIIVTSHPGAMTGPLATYAISLELADDVGDGMGEASAFSPDDVMHSSQGEFETPADIDVYAVVVPTAQQLGFTVCSTSETFKVEVELRNANGDLISSKQNKKCDKLPKMVDVAAGTYFLHLFNQTGDTGSYGLRVSLSISDIDGDDSPGNAYHLTEDAVIGTLFENTGEQDWFQLDAIQGQTYVIEAVGIDPGVDPLLEIYAPSNTLYAPPQLPDTSGHELGHWMVRNDDGGLRGLDARAVFWAPVAGTYRVRVRPDSGSTAGRYHLLVHDNAGVTQAYPAFP